jgi:hypothetical protein
VGHWPVSPLGAITDVMWARPDGERVLLAPDDDVAAFVTAVYAFDDVRVVPIAASVGRRRFDLTAGPLRLALLARRGVPIPGPRPAWVTRWLEAPLAGALLGVRTFGTSPLGVREWYRASRWRPVTHAAAEVDGRRLGSLAPLAPPLGVGFSEPPRRPAWVDVRPRLQDPAGRLDRVLHEITARRR